jgi:hypothetical protein
VAEHQEVFRHVGLRFNEPPAPCLDQTGRTALYLVIRQPQNMIGLGLVREPRLPILLYQHKPEIVSPVRAVHGFEGNRIAPRTALRHDESVMDAIWQSEYNCRIRSASRRAD